MGKEIKMNPGQQQPQVNINPNDLEDVVCEKCENQTFEPVFLFKKLSAVLAPTGRDTLVPLQTYKCTECGHMNDEFLPKEQ
jgi:NAD-dependent dihydropyrimidine dehydrogenase PreA subunit